MTNFTDISVSPKLRPWIRLGARFVDFFLPSFAVGMLWFFFVPPGGQDMASIASYNKACGVLVLLLWLFLESIFLSCCKNTFGKWLFKIKLRDNRDKRLSFSIALRRSFYVLYRGLAFGVPLLILLTLKNSYNDLVKQDTTFWDKKYNLTVTYGKMSVIRTVAASLIIAVITAIFIMGCFV